MVVNQIKSSIELKKSNLLIIFPKNSLTWKCKLALENNVSEEIDVPIMDKYYRASNRILISDKSL